MITIRPAPERGHIKLDWLDTYHTFSFGEYHDPNHMGFRTLRVINEDTVSPSTGFGMHHHHDMEIITYILSGSLQHKDSMGNGSVIHAGEVQYMSAGSGIFHSEQNPSSSEPVHLLQIWIFPDAVKLPPRYVQKDFSQDKKPGKLLRIVDKNETDGALPIHQDATLFIGQIDNDHSITHTLAADRHAWVQITKGNAAINGKALNQGDGAAISNIDTLTFSGDGEFLLFDLA